MASEASFARKLFSVDEHHRTNIRVLEAASKHRSESVLELIVFVDAKSRGCFKVAMNFQWSNTLETK